MSETRNDGGPAFAGGVMPHPTDPKKAVPIAQLSVRDWFAGQALAGEVAVYDGGSDSRQPDSIAGRCYRIADAMLATRSKP